MSTSPPVSSFPASAAAVSGAETELRKLHLGYEEYPKSGNVNVDCFTVSAPDVRHDLHAIPYPFPDDRFDVIEAAHVVEHEEVDSQFTVVK